MGTAVSVLSNEVNQPAGRRLAVVHGGPSHRRLSVEKITINGTSLGERAGEVAGRVWRQLRAHGPATTASIAKSIGRAESDVHMAIGWLAREGKLRVDGDRLALVEHEMRIAI